MKGMTMKLSYAGAAHAVRSDLEETHQHIWESLALPGVWWTAPERIEIAREARRAQAVAGVAELAGRATESSGTELPEGAREVARRVGADPVSLERGWYDSIVPEQLDDA